jgi:hypothetical protein
VMPHRPRPPRSATANCTGCKAGRLRLYAPPLDEPDRPGASILSENCGPWRVKARGETGKQRFGPAFVRAGRSSSGQP